MQIKSLLKAAAGVVVSRLGTYLKQLRKESDKEDLSAMASKLKMNAETLQDIEEAKENPSPLFFQDLSAYKNIDAEVTGIAYCLYQQDILRGEYA